MTSITRKTLLYKTNVEYGDYTINHVEGCSHGCNFPCYAMMMAKRFGKIKSYDDWIKPKIVNNAIELLKKEIPKMKNKIKSVHMSFTTDPFMYGFKEISDLSLKIINLLNYYNVKCTVLTKGILPISLINTKKYNEYGITLISLNEDFRKNIEPNSANYKERIDSLKRISNSGFKTWVSMEPYPTPNIIEQNINDILESIKFVDKIIFGRLNYNSLVSKYKKSKDYYNSLSEQIIEYCIKNKKKYHIKKGTIKKELILY